METGEEKREENMLSFTKASLVFLIGCLEENR
jgi:hypothetical protein